MRPRETGGVWLIVDKRMELQALSILQEVFSTNTSLFIGQATIIMGAFTAFAIIIFGSVAYINIRLSQKTLDKMKEDVETQFTEKSKKIEEKNQELQADLEKKIAQVSESYKAQKESMLKENKALTGDIERSFSFIHESKPDTSALWALRSAKSFLLGDELKLTVSMLTRSIRLCRDNKFRFDHEKILEIDELINSFEGFDQYTRLIEELKEVVNDRYKPQKTVAK